MSDSDILLEARHITCSWEKEDCILKDANLAIYEGDIVIIHGKSGCGKSTLLKILAHLNVYEGELLFYGKSPKSYGVPSYRTLVLYVPQRPSLLPGTPKDFLTHVSGFSAYQSRTKNTKAEILASVNIQRAMDVSSEWGIDGDLWDRDWTNLSGGEAQRIALAAGIGLNVAEILLLDEPTSALDSDTSSQVEKYLKNMLKSKESPTKALVWITHSAEQGGSVGTRFIEIANKTLNETRGFNVSTV